MTALFYRLELDTFVLSSNGGALENKSFSHLQGHKIVIVIINFCILPINVYGSLWEPYIQYSMYVTLEQQS